MSDRRYLTAAQMDSYRRRLRDYSDTYPDSDFLDNAAELAESGRAFTAANAAKVDDALDNWQERLSRARFDPDRCPPGCDPHIWKLATLYRNRTEKQGRWCPSRRVVHWELARVIDRDDLTNNCEPWRDQEGAPGWYRMMTGVITCFTDDQDPGFGNSGYGLLGQLTEPGAVTGIIERLKDDAKAARLDAHAEPANTRLPTPERRARVRAYIEGRKPRG